MAGEEGQVREGGGRWSGGERLPGLPLGLVGFCPALTKACSEPSPELGAGDSARLEVETGTDAGLSVECESLLRWRKQRLLWEAEEASRRR